MTIARAIFLLRLRQGLRYLRELGLFRLLLMVAMLSYGTVQLWGMLEQAFIAYVVGGAGVLTTLGIHQARRDRRFLGSLSLSPASVFAFEYLLLVSPLALLLLLREQWLSAALSLPLAAGIAWLPAGRWQFRKRTRKLPFIPTLAFEWKSGLRQYFPTVLVLYGLSLGFLTHFFVAPIACLLIALTATGFYTTGEGREMIEVTQDSPRLFLGKKIIASLRSFFVLMAPLLLIYVPWHRADSWLMAYALVAASLLLALAVVMKYATYEPGADQRVTGITTGIATLSLVVPFLAPVPLVMLVYYFRKAHQNLNSYLHVAD
jgi:hypothetical protein